MEGWLLGRTIFANPRTTMKHFFDIGAYTGTTFDLFLSKHPEYDDHHIWCFEPNPKAAAWLCGRIENGELDKWDITVCAFGVSSEADALRFHQKADPTGNSFFADLRHDGKVVPNKPFDYELYCAVVGIRRLIFSAVDEPKSVSIKLDCEGAEYDILGDILLDGQQCLNCIHEIYIEWHDVVPNWKVKSELISKAFREAGLPLKPWTV